MHTIRYASWRLRSRRVCATVGGGSTTAAPDAGTRRHERRTRTTRPARSSTTRARPALAGHDRRPAAATPSTTDANGAYTLPVPKNTAYTMTISSDADADTGYLTLNEQEWKLSGDVEPRQDVGRLEPARENLLKGVLQPRPTTTQAVLTVQVIATGACARATGATVSVPACRRRTRGAADGGTGPYLDYFSGGFPSASATVGHRWRARRRRSSGTSPPPRRSDTVTVTPPDGLHGGRVPDDRSGRRWSRPEPHLHRQREARPEPPVGGLNVASFMRVFLK